MNTNANKDTNAKEPLRETRPVNAPASHLTKDAPVIGAPAKPNETLQHDPKPQSDLPAGQNAPALPPAITDKAVVATTKTTDPDLPPSDPESPANMPLFRVTLNGQTAIVPARDETEAWAKFCDGQKSWPSPRVPGRKIERLGDK